MGRLAGALWASGYHDVANWACKVGAGFTLPLDKFESYPAFCHSFSEYALAKQDYKLVLQLWEHCPFRARKHDAIPEIELCWALTCLYRAVALAYTGNLNDASELLANCRPPSSDFPAYDWNHNLWYRYWYARAVHSIDPSPVLYSDHTAIAEGQNWPAVVV